MLEMKIKIEADAAVLKAIDKLTTALEKNAVNISVSQDTPAPVAPTNPAPTVPVTTAPTYTLDQIAKAGASLVDAGKMEQLLALLAKYGVQAVTQLQPDQYGVFATELRTLGAQL